MKTSPHSSVAWMGTKAEGEFMASRPTPHYPTKPSLPITQFPPYEAAMTE